MNRRIFIAWLIVLQTWVGGINPIRAADTARASKPEVRKEVIAVIEGQLEAFRAGDTKKAYGFAATALRAQTARRQFELIVLNSYPEIWSNTRAEFGLVRDDGVRATLLVQVFAKEANASYDYVLVKEREGWRIESVLRHAPKKAEKV